MGKGKHIPSEDWLQLISQRLKLLRKQAGFKSYEDFALHHEIDRKQYWRIENGANVTLRTLVKVLALHDLDLPSFFREMDQQRRK